jgi:signal transduction histidine kinase/integral membrane sensor domain MASE1
MTVQAAASGLPEEPSSPDRRASFAWLSIGTAAYLALGMLGRATIPHGEILSLVWPAAGVGLLLFGLVPRRWWWCSAVLLAGSTVVLNLLTGATWTQAGIFVVSNIVQAIVAVLVIRAWRPGLWGVGGDRPLEQLRDFWPVLAGSVVGSFVGAVLGVVGRGIVLDRWSATDLFVWWSRNATGCVVVFTTVVLGGAVWRRARGPDPWARLRADVEDRVGEAALLVVFTAAVYFGVAGGVSSLPVAFPLLVPTVWAGLRFSGLSVAVHSVAVSTAVVAYTLANHGTIAAIDSWSGEVLVSQLFIGLVFCLGILLALGRGERLSLTANLSRSQAASQNQAEVLTAIIDAMHDGLTVIDEDGQVLLRNPAGAQLVRTDPDHLNNLRDSAFTMLTGDGAVMRPADFPWIRAIAGENVVDQDIVLVFDDDSPTRTIAVSARRLPSQGPRVPAQAVVIYHDVTADRAQRTALESFARVVAHDLRGPLAVIEGWAEMLAIDLDSSGSLSREDAGPKLDRIRTAATGMQHLIGDLLESSMSREQKLRMAEVDLGSVARSVAEQRAAVAREPRPVIEVGELPDVHADGALVRQLLDNLVGNAVKYVVPGQVPRVEVTAREVGDQVEVTVADEGIGIPAAERDLIFEAFHRAHVEQAYDGHGIGLSVCKQIVERHGGRISARPPRGESGTRIVFTLPAARPGR